MRQSLNPYMEYQSNQVNTADQKQLVIMLYDGAVKFLNESIGFLNDYKTYDQANAKIVRVQEIISELMISLDMEKGGEIAQISSGDNAGEWCALNEGTWYKARKISRDCPWPREKVGDKGFYPVCKAWPHFKIKRSNCDGEFWNSSNNTEYCLWNRDGWYRVRQTK